MQATWGARSVRRAYATDGWSDAGEERAFSHLLPLLPATRVLDIGYGGGRTTRFLAPSAAAYVGIDISEDMMRLARSRNAGVDLRVGDAADLSGFDDDAFDLAVFSLNGVDCLSHEQRGAFFRAAWRVLAPGGALLFSTHNLDGPSYGQRPALRGVREWVAREGRVAQVIGLADGLARLAASQRHYRRTAPQAERHGDWALAPLKSHEYRFLVHFARLAQVRHELSASGFVVEGAWTNTGRVLAPEDERHDEHYAHLLCRKVAA